MKTIEVDEELYRYIASHTQHIGESASDILRRMLKFTPSQTPTVAESVSAQVQTELALVAPAPLRERVRAMRELLLSDEYAAQRKVVDRFMLVLATLYQLDAAMFSTTVSELHGRTRTYFADDRQILLDRGTHTQPRQIADTPYWVITNTNSARKRSMVEQIMLAMQFPPELIEKVRTTI
ncbi:replication initiation negative regulator SeqA [Serratia microhaemolytica]|uniref:replication initiation negative regulator SeqA n=1 Tax=Serratia microhaemolytica TaxID=2675110 RepID=UPI000FDDD89F|nr:replication initiation negative regulator SeqA [Serratia microhaemolytica]